MRTSITILALAVVHVATCSDAAEKTVAGKITAVDLENRTISVEGITVDIVRKTRISLGGEPSKLANITAGQSARLDYDDALEVATAIVASRLPDEDPAKTAADLKALQGSWIGVAETGADGKVLDERIISERDRRITISRSNLTMWRTLDNKRLSFEGKFDIASTTGHFDFIGKGPNGEVSEWIGLYQLQGDTLKLCYNFKTAKSSVRPTNFVPAEGEKQPERTYTLKRAAN